ncbi:MAG: OsmC family protein [Candidatus Nealsonbacteria bacterium]|nr:OsmC family protein [Candidatus Nealsonbacteria bacterium]
MSTLRITYDADQHCTALREPEGNTVAMDCPYTGKGEEFTPGNLVGTALAGCMFLSLGAVAQRNKLDIAGASVDVELSMTENRIGSIDLVFTMPGNLSETDRTKLERAAGLCPIKPSFHPDIPISVRYEYSG